MDISSAEAKKQIGTVRINHSLTLLAFKAINIPPITASVNCMNSHATSIVG